MEPEALSLCEQDDDVQGSFFVHSLQGENDNDTRKVDHNMVNVGISILN